MAIRASRICDCGQRIEDGARCPCSVAKDRERKARHDATRPSARERGYTTQWTKEAKAFLAANPSCKRCNAPSTVVDHIMPHKGNSALFWNKANWQPLCTSCHSGAKQAVEKGNRGVVANLPTGLGTGGGPTTREIFKIDRLFVNRKHGAVQ